MSETKQIYKVKTADGKVKLMEAKTISKKEQLEKNDIDLKILGLINNFNRDGMDFFVGVDKNGQYFLLAGKKMQKPGDSYLFNSDWEPFEQDF